VRISSMKLHHEQH